MKYFLQTLDDTRHLAEKLAAAIEAGDVVALSGEVGTGKTTFAQYFIGALLRTPEPVTSPTFTIMQSYETTKPWRVFHADLYRLKHASELEEIGLEDAFEQHVTLIEWPEMAENILPAHTLFIHFMIEGEARSMMICGNSDRLEKVLAA